MSALFNQAARQERERFFFRLDSQWGKGLKQKTHPDRCPDFRVITRPNIASEWGVYSFGDKGLVYESSNKKQVRAWLLAVLTLYPQAHLELRSLKQRSNQTGALTAPRTTEPRLACNAQTLVTSKREPIGKDVAYVALGTFSDAPSPSSLVPDFSGEATRTLAPRECADVKLIPASAQLELSLVTSGRMMFTSGWQWPKVSLEQPEPIPALMAGKQMRLAL